MMNKLCPFLAWASTCHVFFDFMANSIDMIALALPHVFIIIGIIDGIFKIRNHFKK